ncbi:cationic amino acid transporter 4-like [Branchiostoma lanceolatum]|uniref:cationic amino acid transporter 4-like n=1 Tax=Branchiostoma lanceolatum TaxID=7740 RepID=UPI003453C9ED
MPPFRQESDPRANTPPPRARSSLWEAVFRRKLIGPSTFRSPLRRCLEARDLMALGLAAVLGTGIYITVGLVARQHAGPAVLVSFALGGLAAFLTSLCQAEFAARLPLAGAAYTYIYVTVGELWGFLIGWNTVMELTVALAFVGRTWSSHLDALCGHAISVYLKTHVATWGDLTPLADFPDFCAFGAVLLTVLFVIIGAKISTWISAIFISINFVVIVCVIVAGAFASHLGNWTETEFAPFGWEGVITGAAIAFSCFTGLTVVLTSAEETHEANTTLPGSLIMTVVTALPLYIGVSVILTMLVPWNSIDVTSPLPSAFLSHGRNWRWAWYLTTVGCLSAMMAAQVAILVALSRTVYALAADGLFFSFCGKVSRTTQVPVVAALIFGGVAAFLALVLDVESLVKFASMGSLLSYVVLPMCSIISRYQPPLPHEIPHIQYQWVQQQMHEHAYDTEPPRVTSEDFVNEFGPRFRRVGELRSTSRYLECIKNLPAGHVVATCILALTIVLVGCSVLVKHAQWEPVTSHWWVFFLLTLLLAAIATILAVIFAHHQNEDIPTFRLRLIPFLPALTLCLNVLLVVHLDGKTWARCAIWIGIGLLLYFGYGFRHSKALTQPHAPLPGGAEWVRPPRGRLFHREDFVLVEQPPSRIRDDVVLFDRTQRDDITAMVRDDMLRSIPDDDDDDEEERPLLPEGWNRRGKRKNRGEHLERDPVVFYDENI